MNKTTAITLPKAACRTTTETVWTWPVAANDATVIKTTPMIHFTIKLIKRFWYHFRQKN